MLKQIQINGQAFESYSWDGGKSWCSSPKATLAFLRRREKALAFKLSERELRWIDQLNREPDNIVDTDSIRCAVRL